MHYRFVAAIVVCLAGLVAFPQPCEACSCAARTPEQVLIDSSVIFHGTVTATSLQRDGLRETNLVTIQVDEVWNGPVVQELTVLDRFHATGCTAPFVEGTSYTVVGSRVGNIIHSDACAQIVLALHGTSYAVRGQGIVVNDDAPGSLDAITRAPVVATPENTPPVVATTAVATETPVAIANTNIAPTTVPGQEPTQIETIQPAESGGLSPLWITTLSLAAGVMLAAALVTLRRVRGS